MLLLVSNLRPEVGEPVVYTAGWPGEWPAVVPWEGVDADAGGEARATFPTPGERTVRAGEASITVAVQPAANHGTQVIRPSVLPLPAIEPDRCRDDRYPTLAGAFVVGCTAGKVDVAWDLVQGRKSTLDTGSVRPGIGPGVLMTPRRAAWRIEDGSTLQSLVGFDGDFVPPATDGQHAAWAWADRVEAFPLDEVRRTRTDATPLVPYPVALAWPWAAWVEEGGITGEDVWVRGADAERRALARGPTSERHVSGSGAWLAWVDELGVYVADTRTWERRSYPADTGFQFGLGQWGPVVCWEDRAALRAGTGDIDVRCSDGVELTRPGDQRAPARWGPWLIFREEGRLWLATAPELVLDDDDPRASPGGTTISGGWRGAHRDGPVSWELDWPAPGWRVERWNGAAWEPGEPVPVGLVRLDSSWGDAVRLVPDPGGTP